MAYKGQEYDLSQVFLQENGPAFFGRDWLGKIRLSKKAIAFHTVVGKRLDEVLQQFKEVFGEELETACTLSVPLKLKENSQNKFVPTGNPVLGVGWNPEDGRVIIGPFQ